MSILVTGATGFLGSALVAELVKRKQAVRILARDEKKAYQQFGDTVTIIQGEITDARQVQRAVDGVTSIYHLAGRLYYPSTPPEMYRHIHVEGTRILLAACQGQSQLQRIVHCSTTGVFGITGRTPASEDAPIAPTNPYEATKREGELLAFKAYQEQGLPICVVRPGLVYGPGDLHLLGFFAAIHKGLFRVIDGGEALLHPIYIDDMIAALLICASSLPQPCGHESIKTRSTLRGPLPTPDVAEDPYNIAGEQPVTIRELATTIAHALGKELPRGSIPLWLANLAADIFAITPGVGARFIAPLGERAPLTRSRVKFLTNSRVYDCSRAKMELGFCPQVGLDEGMKRTAAWYFEHGYL